MSNITDEIGTLNQFIPLNQDEIKILAKKNDLKEAYLDFLTYLFNIIRDYTNNPSNSFFSKDKFNFELHASIRTRTKKLKNQSSLYENCESNLQTTSKMWEEANVIFAGMNENFINEVKNQVTTFEEQLLLTYDQVRLL